MKSSTANIWAASITAALLTGAAVGQPRLGTVAFIRDGDLWVQDLRDGASSRLTQDGRNSMPRWSRSGEWIAFLKDGQAWVVRRNGRDRQRLAASGETVASVRWSPAADRLAVGKAGVFEVNRNGQWEPLKLPELGAHIVWSPDGQRVIDEEMAIFDLATGRRGAALIASPPGPVIPAAWVGHSVLYWAAPEVSASLLADGLPLWTVSDSRGAPSKTGATALLAEDFLAAAPDGLQVAMVDGCCRESWQGKSLALFDVSSGVLRRLTRPDQAVLSPAWSPDGRRIAFVASHDSGPEEAAKPHRVVRPNGAVVDVPPGKRIGVSLAQSQSTVRGRRIWLMDADGSGPVPLTHDPQFRDERPVWGSGGDRIVFARVDGKGGISLWSVRADGSELALVTNGLSLPAGTPWEYYGRVQWELFFDLHE